MAGPRAVAQLGQVANLPGNVNKLPRQVGNLPHDLVLQAAPPLPRPADRRATKS